ncbi:hypothetical protein AAK873_05360 [Heminiphilus faecis]|uniref:Uncharacterized protein n=1 Tax=Heminiphilus faecis TaxID=2601703 RepID=A0ABV4CXU2_9BACT
MITDILTTYNIPDCSVVDYTDGNKVFGAGHLLLSLMQRTAPYRTRDVAPAPLSAVVKEAKHWIDGVERYIHTIPPHLVLTALYPFDLVHRMAFHRPASPAFLNRWYTHVFNAKVKGDRQISDSALLGVISARLSHRDPLYFDRPLLWYSSTLDRWMKLCAGSAEFADMPLDEALGIAASLIDNDLIVFVPDQDAFKHRLAANYASRLDDIDAGDADTLRAALHFVRTARYRYIAADCAAHFELHLLRQLSRNPNLDPNDRQAYSLDLDYLLAPSLD